MRVPQFEPWVGEEEYKEIASCFKDNWITEGPKSQEFLEKLLKLTGARYGVLAPNGTLALYLGLRVLGIGAQDEVIVPDFTMIASATAVEMTGATPVFVGVNRRNFQIDLLRADKIVSKNTRAIMPVHIYGTVADMKKIGEFAKRHKLKIIEDAAQAIGVHRDGVHAGTFGDVGCFSFFADKTITTAEGGLIVTNNKGLYEKLLYLRNQGRKERGIFIHPEIGYNFRMTDFQSAMGLVQLAKLEKIKARKNHILALYKKLLSGFPEITFFEPDEGAELIPFRVGILTKHAHELIDYLKKSDIEPRTFFYPLHKQPCFTHLRKKYGYSDADFPNSAYAYQSGICLPTFPTLTDAQIKYVVKAISQFLDEKGSLFYKYYDLLYQDKDYSRETNIVLQLSKEYGLGVPKNVLEIGCGTGNHTAYLAKNGQAKITAIDIDPKMVQIAKNKLKKFSKRRLKILHTGVENLKDSDFDLALALFNVVNYIPSAAELSSFMKGVAKRLAPGGIFVFDCWNGVAVIRDPPKRKVTLLKHRGKKITTRLDPDTDFINQKTKLNYEIKVTNGKRTQRGYFSFTHTLWTPRQIREAAEGAGLNVLFCSPNMQVGKKAKDTDWKIMFCCQKQN